MAPSHLGRSNPFWRENGDWAVVVFGETFNEERGGLVGLVSVLWDWRGGGRHDYWD